MASEADAFFDAAIKLAEVIVEVRKRKREQQRLARNERRRRRYKISPPKKREPEPIEDYRPPEGCTCQVCRMPPCSWCENGGGSDEDESTIPQEPT